MRRIWGCTPTFEKAAKSTLGFPSLYWTYPGSPYNFLMDGIALTKDDKADSTFFTITFTIKDTTVTGDYTVALSYVNGEITDENFNALDVNLENGTITIQ